MQLVVTYTCLTNAFFRAILVTVSVEMIERSVMRVSNMCSSFSVNIVRWSKLEWFGRRKRESVGSVHLLERASETNSVKVRQMPGCLRASLAGRTPPCRLGAVTIGC